MNKTGFGLSTFTIRAGLVSLIIAVLLGLVLSSSAQKPPKTEESDTFGVGGKKTTAESKDADGNVTTAENWYDPKGKLRKKKLTTKKPGGGDIYDEELYDCNGQIEGRSKMEFNAQDKMTSFRKEDYQNGILSKGFLWEMDENSDVKVKKEYNPATERYEEARYFDPLENSPFVPPKWPTFPSTCPTSSPGYDADIDIYDGLVRVDFKTAFGGIQVFLPDDLAAGDTCTGSVHLEPSGKTAAERSGNLSKIQELVLEFGRERLKTADSIFTLEIPRTLNSADRFLRCRHRGRIVLEIGIPLYAEQPRILNEFILPTGGQQGRLLEIKGPCNGTAGKNDYVKIGDTTLPLLAESPRKMVLRDTSQHIGPTKLECSENGKVTECPFRNLGIRLSADKLNLLKGETTQLHVAVTGLAGLDQDVPLDLVNNSPSVIDMSGGTRQHTVIRSGDTADGTYRTDRTLTGIVAGSFGITGTIRWRHLCKDGKPLSDKADTDVVGDIARGSFAKDVNGPPGKDGQPQKYRTCGGQCKSPVTDPSGTFCSQERSCSDNVGCQCHMYDSFGKEDMSEWKHVWKPGDSKRTENPNFRCLCVKPK